MKALVQRVAEADVTVDGRAVAAIGPGMLVLLGVEVGDAAADAERLAAKTAALRIFDDDDGRMNRAITEADGAALVVSQFTLAADTSRGNRPSYARAAPPEVADPLYLHYCNALAGHGVPIERGVFGARMAVRLINDVPVTIWLETPGR